jgi:hypothetical protein
MRAPCPLREDLQEVAEKYQTSHTKEEPSPPGDPIPVVMGSCDIDDAIPMEEKKWQLQ